MKTNTSNKQDEAQNASAVRDCPDSDGSHRFAKLGLSVQEMTVALNRLAEVARKVPFPSGEEFIDDLNFMELLRETIDVLNQIPNKRIEHKIPQIKDTYGFISYIERKLNLLDCSSICSVIESTDYSPAENNKIGDLDRLNQDL
jgi:hypothetical protein